MGVGGAGQLARMMGEAASAVNVELLVLASSLDEAATATADHVVLGQPDDVVALRALAQRVDVVTFDHELVNLEQIRALEDEGVCVRPNAHALRFAVDKAYQRETLREAGFAVPRFLVVGASDDPLLDSFLDQLDGPPVLKAARGGYDGRGVLFPPDRATAKSQIDELHGAVVVEERYELRGEVAQLIARATNGSVQVYPLVSTVQSDGMCVEVRYPAEVTAALASEAGALAEQLASLLEAVGILAIEFFVTDGGLVINEVALRPHNSGHWTIEGVRTSQFANHLLAVSGQPLGDVSALTTHAVMVNVVGGEQPATPDAARALSDLYVHDYGKSWRVGRKLGHVTVLGDDAATTHVRAWTGAHHYGTRTREVS